MIESSKKVKPWRLDVKHAALDAKGATEAMTGDVKLTVIFRLARPRSHYRTGANAHLLRLMAPARPAGRPDLDKILRSTCDALGEAGVFGDDAQITVIAASKAYATVGQLPGATIRVVSRVNTIEAVGAGVDTMAGVA